MDVAKDALKKYGPTKPFVFVFAETQVKGRGTQSKSWISPKGISNINKFVNL